MEPNARELQVIVDDLLDLAGRASITAITALWTHKLAHAAGELQLRDQLLRRAEDSESQHPTYYGGAWVALARAMLTTTLLRAC